MKLMKMNQNKQTHTRNLPNKRKDKISNNFLKWVKL